MDEIPNTPIEAEDDSQKRVIPTAIFGGVIVGACALFLLAVLWFQSARSSLITEYFPSSTPTVRPTTTTVPTRTPPPDLTATQRAWIKPAKPPLLASVGEAKEAISSGGFYLEDFASTYPDMPEINQPGDIYIFELHLTKSIPLIWSYGWCTTDQNILEENFTHIQLDFVLNESPVPAGKLAVAEQNRGDGSPCREYAALVKEWASGQHHLEIRVTFTQDIDDGWDLYPAGTHIYKYIVTVGP